MLGRRIVCGGQTFTRRDRVRDAVRASVSFHFAKGYDKTESPGIHYRVARAQQSFLGEQERYLRAHYPGRRSSRMHQRVVSAEL
jgi:hypothetical protein